MKKSVVSGIIGAVVLAVVVVGILVSRGKPDTLSFGTFSKSLGNAPYHVAKHFGWFEEDPVLRDYNISYTLYNDRPTISQAFDKGELQMLFSAEVPAIMCLAQGNRIRVVDIASTVFLKFLVRSELDIDTVEGLKGHPIGFLRGTSSHYGLLKNLSGRNLDEGDFDIRFMSPPEARTAFETGQLDCWVIWSPFLDIQLMKGKAKEVPDTEYPITNTMAIPTKLIDEKPEVVRALVKVIERAKKWITEHPEEAVPILAQELGLDLDVVRVATKNFDYDARMDAEVLADFQAKADFLAEQEKTRLDRPVNIKTEFVDLQFLK